MNDAERSAWGNLRDHFLDEMTQAYENGGDIHRRVIACTTAEKLLRALDDCTCAAANAAIDALRAKAKP